MAGERLPPPASAGTPCCPTETWRSAMAVAAKVQAPAISDAEAQVHALHAAALILVALGKLPAPRLNGDLPPPGPRMAARMLEVRRRLLTR